MAKIRAVIFDIGNVLIRWQPEAFFDGLIPQAQRQRLFAEVDLHAMNEAIDSGAPFRQTVYDTASRYPEHSAMIRLWHDRWADIAAPAIEGSARLNTKLRQAGIKTAILSNIGQETYDIAAEKYPFLHEFDAVFLSGPLGVTKPSAGIYELVENGLGLPPASLLFADDRAENIAAATDRGWQGHLFADADGFQAHLTSLGLLPPPGATG